VIFLTRFKRSCSPLPHMSSTKKRCPFANRPVEALLLFAVGILTSLSSTFNHVDFGFKNRQSNRPVQCTRRERDSAIVRRCY
jgi:hypothetical protein